MKYFSEVSFLEGQLEVDLNNASIVSLGGNLIDEYHASLILYRTMHTKVYEKSMRLVVKGLTER